MRFPTPSIMLKQFAFLLLLALPAALQAQKMRSLLGLEGGVGASVSQQGAFYPYAATGLAKLGQLSLVSPGDISLVMLDVGYTQATDEWKDYGQLSYNEEKLADISRSNHRLNELYTENFTARLGFNVFLSQTSIGRPQVFIGGAFEGYILRQSYLFPVTRTTVQLQTMAGCYQTTLGLAGRAARWQYLAELAYAPITYYSGAKSTSTYTDSEIDGDFTFMNFKTFNARIHLQADYFIGKHFAVGGRIRANSWRINEAKYPISSLQNLTLSAAASYAF